MGRLVFHTDQIVKQKQYKDLLHEVKYFCLARAVARPPPNRLQEVTAALGEAMVRSTRDWPGFRPVEWQARS